MSTRSTGGLPRLRRLSSDTLHITLPEGAAALGSLEGFKRVKHVIVHRVDVAELERLGYWRYREELIRSLGLEHAETAVLMTAAELARLSLQAGSDFLVLVTVGLGAAACPELVGVRIFEQPAPSTINVLVWVSTPLSEAGIADLFRGAAEAKAVASTFLPLRCPRYRPMGTTSDAILVAAPLARGGAAWCGPATRCGAEAIAAVFEAVLLAASRTAVDDPLDVLGTSEDMIVSDFRKLYSQAPIEGLDPEEAAEAIVRVLRRLLGNVDVKLMLTAAYELDRHLNALRLVRGYEEDPRWITADELLATALALYLAGFRGLLSTYWVDRVKQELGLEMARLGVFSDDVIAALLGSALTRLLEALHGGERPVEAGRPSHGGRPC